MTNQVNMNTTQSNQSVVPSVDLIPFVSKFIENLNASGPTIQGIALFSLSVLSVSLMRRLKMPEIKEKPMEIEPKVEAVIKREIRAPATPAISPIVAFPSVLTLNFEPEEEEATVSHALEVEDVSITSEETLFSLGEGEVVLEDSNIERVEAESPLKEVLDIALNSDSDEDVVGQALPGYHGDDLSISTFDREDEEAVVYPLSESDLIEKDSFGNIVSVKGSFRRADPKEPYSSQEKKGGYEAKRSVGTQIKAAISSLEAERIKDSRKKK